MSTIEGRSFGPGASPEVRNELFEHCIDMIYGFSYDMADGNPDLTEEYFQEVSLNVLETLAEEGTHGTENGETIQKFTARMALEARNEASIGLDLHEPFVDSWEESGIDIEGFDETSEHAIRAADTEIYEERLPKLIGGRALEIVSAVIIDEAERAETGRAHDISGSRVGQIVDRALLRLRHSSLGEDWEHGYTHHVPLGHEAQSARYAGSRQQPVRRPD